MTKAQQAELDAAKEAVVVAAKAWRKTFAVHVELKLSDAVERLETLESAAIRALPGRGKKKNISG